MPEPPVATPPGLLRRGVERHADRPLLRFPGSTLTYAETDAASDRLAAALTAGGVTPGERVAALLPDGPELPLLWLALGKLGAVMVPLNPRFGDADLGHVLDHSRVPLVVTSAAGLEAIEAVRGRCPALGRVAVAGGDAPAGVWDLSAAAAAAGSAKSGWEPYPGDLVTLQYTSGTTGLPKGCMLHHGFYVAMAAAVCQWGDIGAGEVVLTAQSWCYLDPWWNLTLCLLAGATLVSLPGFDAAGFWPAVRDHGVTFFYCLGAMPALLLRADDGVGRDHSVRRVLCSGIVPELHAELEERWGAPWREAYGSTELGAVLAVPLDDAASVGSGAVGRPLRGIETRLAPVSGDDGVGRGGNGQGELQVRGGTPMRGYFRDRTATEAFFRGGWAHTGDLMEQREDGAYRMVGRLKEMIRRGGENVSAAEVEGVLVRHRAVRTAACLAVPDAVMGEEVQAVLELEPGIAAGEETVRSVLEFAGSQLAAFKLPRYTAFVEQMPLTPSERVAKHRLAGDGPLAGSWDARAGGWLDGAGGGGAG